MEVPIVKLAEKFGIRPKQIHKYKGKYILSDGKNKFLLSKSFCTRESIVFQNSIMECAKKKGFENIDCFFLSEENKPFIFENDEIYVMNRFYEYEEINFADDEIIKKAISLLAQFHETLSKSQITTEFISENMFSKIDSAEYKMKQIKKKILQSKKLSEFDMIFLKNYDLFLNRIYKCRNILESNGYLELFENAILNKSISLNRIKKDSFKIYKGKIILTDFTDASVNLQTSDLALLSLRYLKLSESAKLSLEEIACCYEENPSRELQSILSAHILFPENYIKNIQLFYEKKRKWIPSSFTNKMNSILAVSERVEFFI